MLLGISTAHDAGIGIYGDHNDLKCLHETIHYLCNHPNVEEHLGEFVLGFAYEVRKSLEGGRETKHFGAGREGANWFSDEYRAFEKMVRAEAKKIGCSPQSLRSKGDWPDSKW